MEMMKRVLALLLVFAMLMPNLSTIAMAADTEELSVLSTEPVVTAEETEAPVETTAPPTEQTEPPAQTTEPPTEQTEPPAQTTEPPTEQTEPPAQTTVPAAEETEPSAQETEAIVIEETVTVEETVTSPAAKETVVAEPITETVTVEQKAAPASGYSNDDMFAMYLDRLMYPNRPVTFGTAGLETLNEKNQSLYRALADLAAGLAANGGSSVYTPTDEQVAAMGFRTSMTAEDIAGTAYITGLTAEHKTKIKEILDMNLSAVIDALLVDLPYEMYWYDKTSSASLNYSIRQSGYNVGGQAQYTDFEIANLTITFQVASAYQDGNSTTVSSTAARQASAVVTTAEGIVETNKNKSDHEKLIAYKDYICSQVVYNDEAASSDYTGGYGDPWQLIYVFDGSSATDVVCEGYAKAFQYLCDLTAFDNNTVESFLVSGYAGGPHMWNIVSIDGRNFMVDVTNTDECAEAGKVTFGQDGTVFLTGTEGSIAQGYTFTNTYGRTLTYQYSYDVHYTDGTMETLQPSVDIYGDDADSILNLSDISYAEYLQQKEAEEQQQQEQAALREELAEGAYLDREVKITEPATFSNLTVAEGGRLIIRGADVILSGESYANGGTIELTEGAKLTVQGNLYLEGRYDEVAEKEYIGTLRLNQGTELLIHGEHSENTEGRIYIQKYGSVVNGEGTVSVPQGTISLVYGEGSQTNVPGDALYLNAFITDGAMLEEVAAALHTVVDGNPQLNFGNADLYIHQDLVIEKDITINGGVGVVVENQNPGEDERVTLKIAENGSLTLQGCYVSVSGNTEISVEGKLNDFGFLNVYGRLICEKTGHVNVLNEGCLANYGMVYVLGTLVTEAEGSTSGSLQGEAPIYASEGVESFLSVRHLTNQGNGWYEFQNSYFGEAIQLTPGQQFYMIAYLNQWNYDTLDWDRTPVHASKLVADGNLVLEPFRNITDGSNHTQEGENFDCFFRVRMADGAQSGETHISYSNTDIQIPVYMGRHADGFYSADPTAEGADPDKLWLNEFRLSDENRTFYFYFDSSLYRDGTWSITEAAPANPGQAAVTKVKEGLWKIEVSEECVQSIYSEQRFFLELEVWYSNGETGYEDYPSLECCAPEFGEPRATFEIDGERYHGSFVYDGLFRFEQGENGRSYPVPAAVEGVSYDINSNTLTLDGAHLKTLKIDHHWYDEERDEEGWNLPDSRFNIRLIGENSISATNERALFLNNEVYLTILGDGSLNIAVTGDENNTAFCAVEANNSDITIEDRARVTVSVSGMGCLWEDGRRSALAPICGHGEDRWLHLRGDAVLTTRVPDGACANGYFAEDGTFVEDGGFGGIEFPFVEVNDNATLNTQTLRVWDEGRGNAYGAYYQNGGTVNVSAIAYYNKDHQGENGVTGHYHFSGVEANYGQIDINGGVLNIDITATEEQQAKSVYYHGLQSRGRRIGLNGGVINITGNIPGTGLKVGEDDWDGGTNAWVDFNNCTLNMTGGELYRKIIDVAPNGSINFNGGSIHAKPADIEIRGHANWNGTQADLEGSGIHIFGTAELNGGFLSVKNGFFLVHAGGALIKRECIVELENSFVTVDGEMHLESGAFIQSLEFDVPNETEDFAQAFVITSGGRVELSNDAYLEIKGTGKVDGICNQGTFLQNGGTLVADVDEGAFTAALFGPGNNRFEDGFAYLNGYDGLVQFNGDENSGLYVGGGALLNAVGRDAGIVTYAPAVFEGGSVNAHAAGEIRTVTDEAGNVKTVYPYAVIVENNSENTNASLTILSGEHYFGTLYEEDKTYPVCARGLGALNAPVAFNGGALTIDAELAVFHVTDGAEPMLSVPVIVSRNTGEVLTLTEAEDGAYTVAGCVDFLTSRNCGENVQWKLEDGVLTISGTGAMDDYHMPLRDPASWRVAPWYAAAESITRVVVEEGVTHIGDWAFGRLPEVTEIVYPSTVSRIDMTSSYACPKLEKFTVAQDNETYSVTDGGKVLVENGSLVRAAVKSITSYAAGDAITTIGMGAFDSSDLAELDLNQVQVIQNYAFADCHNLKEVVIPEGVKTIEMTVFQNSGLESITIPVSVGKIRNYAFDGCSELSNVYFGGSESQWNAIAIGSGNNALTGLPITFLATSEEEAGEPYLSYRMLTFGERGYFEELGEPKTEMTIPVGFYPALVVYCNVWNDGAGTWERFAVDPEQLYAVDADQAVVEDLEIGAFRNYEGISIDEGEPNGYNFFEMAFHSGWGTYRELCMNVGQNKVAKLRVNLARSRVGFYSEDPTDPAGRDETWLNYYPINPNISGHSVYFALTEYDGDFSAEPVIDSNRLSAEDLEKVRSAVEKVNGSVYRITLPDEVAAKVYDYRGIPLQITYEIEGVRETIEFLFGSVSFAGTCYSFVINGVWYEYYPGLEGYFSWDNENQKRLAYRELPGGIRYDYESDTLTMDHSTIESLQVYWHWHDDRTGDSGYATRDDDLTLKLIGENKIINPNSNAALAVGGDLTLTITGDADSSLLISATNANATADNFSPNAVNIYDGGDLIIAGDTSVTTSIESNDRMREGWLMNLWGGGNNTLTIRDNASLTTTVPAGARDDGDDRVDGYRGIDWFGQVNVEGNATLMTQTLGLGEYYDEHNTFHGRGAYVQTGGTVTIEALGFDNHEGRHGYQGFVINGGTAARISGGKLTVRANAENMAQETFGENGSYSWFEGIQAGGYLEISGENTLVEIQIPHEGTGINVTNADVCVRDDATVQVVGNGQNNYGLQLHENGNFQLSGGHVDVTDAKVGIQANAYGAGRMEIHDGSLSIVAQDHPEVTYLKLHRHNNNVAEFILNNGTVTVDNGSSEGTPYAVYVQGRMELNGGTMHVSGTEAMAVHNGAELSQNGAVLNVTGYVNVLTVGSDSAVYLNGGATEAILGEESTGNDDGAMNMGNALSTTVINSWSSAVSVYEGGHMEVNDGHHTFRVAGKPGTDENGNEIWLGALDVSGSVNFNGGTVLLDAGEGGQSIFNRTAGEESTVCFHNDMGAVSLENGTHLDVYSHGSGENENYFALGTAENTGVSGAKILRLSAGEQSSWRIETDGAAGTTTLIISGQQDMYNYYMPQGEQEENWEKTPWFDYHDRITHIVVEEGISHIGDWVFSRMPELVTVTLPGSVNHISTSTFYGCGKLERFDMPGNDSYRLAEGTGNVIIEGGWKVFMAAPSVTQFHVPSNISEIGGGAFQNCTKLSSVTFETDENGWSNVWNIGNGAFENTGLTQITLPEGIKSVGRGAFANCGSVAEISLPVSVNAIRPYAFAGCGTADVTVSYAGNESQWNQITVGTGNSVLDRVTFLGSAAEAGEAYLTFRALNMGQNGWEENENPAERNAYAYAGMNIFGVFYYNQWDETGSKWTATPVIPTAASGSGVVIERIDEAMLEEFHWQIADGEPNSSYFLRVSVGRNAWDSDETNYGIVTYGDVELDIRIHRDEGGFYSAAVASDEAWLNEYEMNPLKKTNAFYFIFENSEERVMDDSSFHIWNHNGIPDSYIRTYDMGEGIFRIVLDPIYMQDVWKYGGFQLWAGYNVTVAGADQPEYRETNLQLRPMDLGNPDAAIEIDDQEYLYFAEENGWMTHGDPANDWRPGVVTVPAGVSYDYSTNTLTLNNASLNNLGLTYQIYDQEGKATEETRLPNADLKLNLIGSSVIESGHRNALRIDGNLNVTVQGEGSLRVHSHNDPENRNEEGQRYAFDTVRVENGSVWNIAGGNVTVQISGEGYWDEGNPAMPAAIRGWNGAELVISGGTLTTEVPEHARDNGPGEADFEYYYSTHAIGEVESITVSGGTLNTTSLYMNRGTSYVQTGGTVNITGLGHISRQQNEHGDQYQNYHYNGIQIHEDATAQISGGSLNLTVTPRDWEHGSSSYYSGLSIAGGEAIISGTAKIHVTGAFEGCGISVGHDYDENGQPCANGKLSMTGGTLTVSNEAEGYWINGLEVGEDCTADISGGILDLTPENSISGIGNRGTLTISGTAKVCLTESVWSNGHLIVDGADIDVLHEEGDNMYAWDIVPGSGFDFRSGAIDAENAAFMIGGKMNIRRDAVLTMTDSDFHADGTVTLNGGSMILKQTDPVDNRFIATRTDAWGNTWDEYEHQSRMYVTGELNLNSGELSLTNVSMNVEGSAVVNQNGAAVTVTNATAKSAERKANDIESDDWIVSARVDENATMNFIGGSFTMTNTNFDTGLESNGRVNIRDGSVVIGMNNADQDAENGLRSNGDLNMDGGTLSVDAPGGFALAAQGRTYISGGTVNLSGEVGYHHWYEAGFEQGSLTVTGGSINIDAVNTGIDLYNDMVVTGGNIDIDVSGYTQTFTDEQGQIVTMLAGCGIMGFNDTEKLSISINGGTVSVNAPVSVPAGCNAVSVYGILGRRNATVRINGGDVHVRANTALYAESLDNAKHVVINNRLHVLSMETGNTLNISSGIVEVQRDEETVSWYVDTFEEDETWTTPYNNIMMAGYAKDLRIVRKTAGTGTFWDMEDGVLTISAAGDSIGNMVKSADWNHVADKVTGLVLDANVQQPADLTQDLFPNLQSVKTPCHMSAAGFTGVEVELVHELVDGKCQKCAYSEVEAERNVFTDTVNHSVLYKDKIQIQYHFNLADPNVEATRFGALIWTAAEYEAELEAFTIAKAGKTQYTSDDVYDIELVKQSGRYRADNEGQKPRELHVEYYAVPYAIVEGKYLYGNADLYSVQQYADDILTKSTNAASRKTVEAMMLFAKYTQLYLGDTNNVSVFENVLAKHNLAANVEWTADDELLLREQIAVEQPEYSANFTAWAGTSLLMKDQTGLGFVLKGKFEDAVEVLYWNASDYAKNSTAPIKGTETGVLEKLAYSTTYDQALKTGISARLSEDAYYVRMYNTSTGEYSEIKADSVATNLSRMVNKYSDGTNDKALKFAQAYLKYAATAKAYLGS